MPQSVDSSDLRTNPHFVNQQRYHQLPATATVERHNARRALKTSAHEPELKLSLRDFVEFYTYAVSRIPPDQTPRIVDKQADPATIKQLLRDSVDPVTPLIEFIFLVGTWSPAEFGDIWCVAIDSLSAKGSSPTYSYQATRGHLCAALILSALCANGSREQRLGMSSRILPHVLRRNQQGEPTERVGTLLAPQRIAGQLISYLELPVDEPFFINEWILEHLRAISLGLAGVGPLEMRDFDELEVFIALNVAHAPLPQIPTWIPTGCFASSDRYRSMNLLDLIESIRKSLEDDGDDSVYVQSKLLGRSKSECLNSIAKVLTYANKARGTANC